MANVNPQLNPFFSLAISDTSAHSSAQLPVLNYNYVGLQLITTGTLAGTWLIEVSNDFGLTWSAITSAFSPTFTNPSGTATSQFGQCVPLVAGALRVTFTASSGSGTAKAVACLKQSRT